MGKKFCFCLLISISLISLKQSLAVDIREPASWTKKTTSIFRSGKPRTTFERLLPLAELGDPNVQNILGFMFFHGEGVALDYEMAHLWFHRAAEQGNLMAQRNLGLFHTQTRPQIPDHYFNPIEANFWFSLVAAGTPGGSKLAAQSYQAFTTPMFEDNHIPPEQGEIGKNVFITFCAGCHGFDGHSAYPTAPSFALGESLDQSDSILLASIMNGKNTMPAWRKTISQQQAHKVLLYIRSRFSDEPVNRSHERNPFRSPNTKKKQIKNSLAELGEKTYAQFCAGCHGFNGISYYVNSPSFALRERMEKSDAELARSITKGRGVMPSWERMLSPLQVSALVQFIRTLAPSYESGIDGDLLVPPDLYFLFRPLGETSDDWHNRMEE